MLFFRRLPRAALILVPLLVVSDLLQADYSRGLDAYLAHEYDRAHVEWMAVADSPPETVEPEVRAAAFYGIALLYCNGYGVWQDAEICADWLTKSAELEFVGAQASLGYLYMVGKGVPQSDTEALKWLRLAALQDDAVAQYNLGTLYRDGIEGTPDIENAAKWLRRAAANGHPESTRVLAELERDRLRTVQNGLAPVAVATEGLSSSQPAGDVPAEPTLDSPMQAGDLESADDRAPLAQAISPPPSDVSSGPAGTMGEEWIRERDPEHYTIQVTALRNVQKLHDFIERLPDWTPFAIYRRAQEGAALWVLVQGDYAGVEEARRAVKEFLAGLVDRDDLWIRRFQAIQNALP